jgi:hypothetical protein
MGEAPERVNSKYKVKPFASLDIMIPAFGWAHAVKKHQTRFKAMT